MNIFYMRFAVFYLLCFTISCNTSEVENINLVSPECNASSNEIIDLEKKSSAVILDIEKIRRHEMRGAYSFSFNLPSSIEYCGYIPVFLCGVGVPDRYRMVDTSLKKEFMLQIETDKSNFFHYKEQLELIINPIDTVAMKEKELHKYNNEKKAVKNILRKRGIQKTKKLPRTHATFKDENFYGAGTTYFYESGRITQNYHILGFKDSVLVRIDIEADGNTSYKRNINQAYCILESLKLNI